MSSIRREPARRRSSQTLSSLIYATIVGAAANRIHSAFGNGSARRPAHSAQPRQQSRKLADKPKTEDSAGKGSGTPAEIPKRGWWAILKRTFSEVGSDRVLAVAGGVTFYSLLSLFPAITVLVSLYGLIADPSSIGRHLDMLKSVLPEGAISIIGEQVTRIARTDHSSLSIAAIVGILLALWSANSAIKAMMDALNIAYDAEERRGFVKLNLVSLGFTLSAIVGLILMITVVAAVPVILQLFWLGEIADFLLWAGRWPVIFALIVAALAFLYQYGPDRPNVAWRWITPGSILASIGLVVFSMLFSWYAANFADYNETYGSLGAVIGFLTWMWLSATIVLIGAELNAEIENQARPGPKPGETGSDKK